MNILKTTKEMLKLGYDLGRELPEMAFTIGSVILSSLLRPKYNIVSPHEDDYHPRLLTGPSLPKYKLMDAHGQVLSEPSHSDENTSEIADPEDSSQLEGVYGDVTAVEWLERAWRNPKDL